MTYRNHLSQETPEDLDRLIQQATSYSSEFGSTQLLAAHIDRTDMSDPKAVKELIGHYLHYILYQRDNPLPKNANHARQVLPSLFRELAKETYHKNIAKLHLLEYLANQYDFSPAIKEALQINSHRINGQSTLDYAAIAQHDRNTLQREIEALQEDIRNKHEQAAIADKNAKEEHELEFNLDTWGVFKTTIDDLMLAAIQKHYPEKFRDEIDKDKLYKEFMKFLPRFESVVHTPADVDSAIKNQLAQFMLSKKPEIESYFKAVELLKITEPLYHHLQSKAQANKTDRTLKHKAIITEGLMVTLKDSNVNITERINQFKTKFKNQETELAKSHEPKVVRAIKAIKRIFSRNVLSFWKGETERHLDKISRSAQITKYQR